MHARSCRRESCNRGVELQQRSGGVQHGRADVETQTDQNHRSVDGRNCPSKYEKLPRSPVSCGIAGCPAETLKTSGHPGSSPSRLSLAGHVAQGCWLDRSSATTAKFKRDQING
jgi:hypothetical protein